MAGTKYNDLIHGLKIAGVNINRKMLADLAVNDFDTFKDYCELAKSTLAEK